MPAIRVLVVDDTPHLRAVVRTILGSAPGFELVGEAEDGEEAVEMVARLRPDIVLMDVEMPGLNGLAATAAIMRSNPEIKVVAWTNHEEPALITEMVAAGAAGYLLKGIQPREFLDSMASVATGASVLSPEVTFTVVQELARLYRNAQSKAEELAESYLNTVQALAAALETKDDQTGNHARRVRDYATIVTSHYDAALLESESLVFGFLLHDVGKIGIPEHILMKPGPLTENEWKIMRRHPELGARIVGSAPFLNSDAVQVVSAHHERWDGSGYPNRMAKEEIPIGARLFSVADTFDAITSDRPYRLGLPFEAAIAEIERCSGSQFDPEVFSAFIEGLPEIEARYRSEVSDIATTAS